MDEDYYNGFMLDWSTADERVQEVIDEAVYEIFSEQKLREISSPPGGHFVDQKAGRFENERYLEKFSEVMKKAANKLERGQEK